MGRLRDLAARLRAHDAERAAKPPDPEVLAAPDPAPVTHPVRVPAPEADHRATVAGYLAAGLQRPPSWSDPTPPPPGAWCACCGRADRLGGRWWTEASDPRGWRCTTCHPPPPGLAVAERVTS